MLFGPLPVILSRCEADPSQWEVITLSVDPILIVAAVVLAVCLGCIIWQLHQIEKELHLIKERTAQLRSPSAEDRLLKSLRFAESDVIIFVVRASGVHELGYGHKWDWEA